MFSRSVLLKLRSGGHEELRRFFRSFKNPGIHRREKLLSVPHNELEDVEFEDLESDFMDVHKSHKQHIKDMEVMKEKEKYIIVRQKYFKEKYPNFLTWHDKEQIKYLHNSNPEEWTVEALSESFPALPEVIAKVVRGNWKKADNRIKNHDSAVQKNWDDFKKGQFASLPQNLVEHLNKFTNRSLNFGSHSISNQLQKKVQTKPKIKLEFSEIISSYQKLENKSSDEPLEYTIKNKKQLQEPPKQGTYINPKYKSKRDSITLTQLQSNLVDKATCGEEIGENDKLMLNTLGSKLDRLENTENSLQAEMIDLSQIKYSNDSGAISTYFKKAEDLSHLNYPEKIVIPKEIRKRGRTYKLNDCYYDYDGQFLYRVPGME